MAAEDLYTVAELAAKWRCSKNLVYDEIARGDLQCVNLGTGTGRGMTRIPESIADEYWRKRLTPMRTVLHAVPTAA